MTRPAFAAQRVRLLIIVTVLAVVAVFGAREVYLRATHVYESDARVTADMITMSSRAEGWVMDLAVREGETVAAGQIIARIDDRVAKLRAEALRAQLLGVQADRVRLQAERRMVENQIDAKSRTRGSAVEVTGAARDALDSDILLARQELDRTRLLYERKVVTEKQLETAQAAVTRLENTKRRMDAERAQAEGALAEAHGERDRLAVLDGQLARLEHVEADLGAQLRQQLVDVEDRTLRAPVPAIIDRTFVIPGEYVGSGQRLLIPAQPRRRVGRGQHQGDASARPEARADRRRHRRRVPQRPLPRQGRARRQRHDGALRAAADAQPVGQFHQDHAARAGEDRVHHHAPPARSRHDGRGGH
ncbi:MAG: biotin/lipoyl-binding protein [Rhodospirillales bacterium]|nr:MAG: biotin/lipoyl-binding protein [Rhodospirillales bacterium]